MKSLKQIREASGGKEAYQKFFNSLLKKFGVSSPSELSGDKKKEFYDALDSGWDGDNEKPEKNERYGDPDNLDPETSADSDEDMADKAASHVTEGSTFANKLRGPAKEVFQKALAQIKKDGIRASDERKRNAVIDGIEGAKYINDRDMRDIKRAMTYESVIIRVDEALRAGRGKIAGRDALDLDYMGDKRDAAQDSKKHKINIKLVGNSGAVAVTGDKKNIINWLTSDDYGMDDEDIEDMFPELLESRFPKLLSVIREWSGDAETQRKKKRRFEDAEEEAYDMNEKMVMCEHCGKMHEEGGCGMNESEIHLSKLRAAKFAPKSKWAALKKKFNVTIDPSDPRWAQGKPQDLHKFAIAMGMSKNDIKKTYNHITPEYKGASNITNKQRESVKEANRFSKKLKGDAKSLWQRVVVYKQSGKAKHTHGDKEWDAMVDKMAKDTKVSPKDIAAVKQAVRHESVNEAKAPRLSSAHKNQIHKIARKHSGDMERAIKEIEKMKIWAGQGIKDNPYVMDVLRQHNEDVNEALSKGQMAHDKEYMHKKLKGNNNKSMKITTAKALKIKVDGDTLVMTPKQDKLAQKHKVTIRNDKNGDISVWGKGDDVHKFLGAMGMRTEDVNEAIKAGKGNDSIGTDVDWDNVGDEKKWIKQAKSKYKVTIKKDVGRYHSGASISGKKSDLIKFLKGPMYGGVDDRDIEDMWPHLLEGVNVDRRTKGFKEALKRQEAAKIKREKFKAKREKKKNQAELDARYDYDGEVDTVLAAANSVMLGKKLPEDAAANSVASGQVDMAPNMGKKKKKKELLARRSY